MFKKARSLLIGSPAGAQPSPSPHPPSPTTPPPPCPVSTHEWYAGMPMHVRLGALPPWLIHDGRTNYRGWTIPSVHHMISARYMCCLYRRAFRLFDDEFSLQYLQDNLPRRPRSTPMRGEPITVFEEAPPLYDALDAWMATDFYVGMEPAMARSIAMSEVVGCLVASYPHMDDAARVCAGHACLLVSIFRPSHPSPSF